MKGRAHRKSAGPTLRAGATSDRIEMPAGSDVAQEVDSYPVPKRPRVRRRIRPALKPKSGYKPEARALKAASPGPRRH